MKKFYCLLIFCISFFTKSFTQITALSTWVSGDNISNQPAVYGTKGVADPANKPSARSGAVSWMDAAGNLWLFGGYYVFDQGESGYEYNDLWKYNPSTNQWTWVSGDNVPYQPAVYGTKGVADPANKPGGRAGAVSWIDAAGNLWLMGGYYISDGDWFYLNDLWMFNPTTNQWTWVSGDNVPYQPAVYGTKGVADPANKPGARQGAVSWTDASGNFWLMGGDGYASSEETGSGHLNDLWKYNPSTNQWTWVSGDNTIDQPGVYGTKGVASASNKPGGRSAAVSWTDAAGNLWLMGGFGFSNTSITDRGYLNDLWKYNPSTNQWTWVSGDNTIDQPGVYGTKGVASASNKPGGRIAAVSWTDAAGNLWLMGGFGYTTGTPWGDLNDLWKYNPSTNQWTWVSGDNTINQPGVYGTKGVADPANKPGARTGAVSWTDAAGNLWLMGGKGPRTFPEDNFFNDLWKITITNTNNDAPPVVSIEDKTVYEAEGKVKVRVSLSHVSSQKVNVKYETVDGTATSRKGKGTDDYKSTNGVLKIPAGQSFGIITVDVNSCDAAGEADEFFTINLSLDPKADATLGDGTARITIKDGAAGKKTSACSCKTGQSDRLSVKVGPNPSRHRFAIETKSSSNDWLEIQVTDHQSGRVVEWMHKVAANSTIYLGENYRPGVYYVKVRQGENVEILRLIKQAN